VRQNEDEVCQNQIGWPDGLSTMGPIQWNETCEEFTYVGTNTIRKRPGGGGDKEEFGYIHTRNLHTHTRKQETGMTASSHLEKEDRGFESPLGVKSFVHCTVVACYLCSINCSCELKKKRQKIYKT
jgi:hypothetical protein